MNSSYEDIDVTNRPTAGPPCLRKLSGKENDVERMCVIPLLFITTCLAVISFTMGRNGNLNDELVTEHLEFSSVPDYFMQDDAATDSETFDFKENNFGLISRSYESDASFDPDLKKTQWQRFEAEVERLNTISGPKIEYKVFYMGRHGEGYHNVAESFYGTEAWDCYWSLQTGNTTATWLDAELTPLGISQAKAAHDFWATMIKSEKIPVPQVYYVSPLLRCLQTAWNTFTGLDLPVERPFKPVIKENIRECIGVHTCDMRSPKSTIQNKFPDWLIEDGFSENDLLWSPTLRETDEAMDQRTNAVIREILKNDKHTFISISSHSNQITSTLRVLGHRKFKLNTGQAIPVLIKITRVPGPLTPEKKALWYKPKTCTSPP